MNVTFQGLPKILWVWHRAKGTVERLSRLACMKTYRVGVAKTYWPKRTAPNASESLPSAVHCHTESKFASLPHLGLLPGLRDSF